MNDSIGDNLFDRPVSSQSVHLFTMITFIKETGRLSLPYYLNKNLTKKFNFPFAKYLFLSKNRQLTFGISKYRIKFIIKRFLQNVFFVVTNPKLPIICSFSGALKTVSRSLQ